MITDAGTLVRTRVVRIVVGRNTRGVILIRTAEDRKQPVGLQRVAEPADDEEELDAITTAAWRKGMDIAPEAEAMTTLRMTAVMLLLCEGRISGPFL